jgi:hypothetical protein
MAFFSKFVASFVLLLYLVISVKHFNVDHFCTATGRFSRLMVAHGGT